MAEGSTEEIRGALFSLSGVSAPLVGLVAVVVIVAGSAGVDDADVGSEAADEWVGSFCGE